MARKERILFVCHGNDIYLPAKFQLREHGIPYESHRAHQMTREE